MKKLFKEFTAAQLARLKKEYDPLKGQRIPMSQIDKMNTMLSKYSTDMLVKLANTDIPFLATAAKSIAVMKRGKKWSDFKTKLDMSEADELQCEACWDSHKQVGTKISSRTGKRVPNCVPKEELQEVLDVQESSMKRLLQALQDKLSDEGGAAGFDDLKKTAKSMGVNLTPAMLKDIPGIKQHRDGDYILEADLSKSQVKMVHKTADKMPKKDFMKRYGKDGDSVRYATATNMVKKKLGIGEEELEESTVELSKLLLKKGEGEKGKGPGLTPAEEKRLAELEQDALNKFKNEELDETFTKKDFKDNERDNEHGLNAKKVVDMFGTGAEKMKIDAINARHNMKGYISREDQRKRDDIVNKYYNKLKEQRAHTSPEVAAALRQYVAQRPLLWRGDVGKADKKDFEELMRLALRDMKAFNKKFNSMDTDPRDGVRQALMKKGLQSHITDETKPRGDQEMNESYKDKFNATMKKFGINSLDDLKSDSEKKKFFRAVDNAHDAKNEELEEGLTPAQKKLPAGLQKAILKKKGSKDEGAMKRGDNLDTYKPKPKNEMMTKEMMDEMMKEMMKEMSSKMEMLKAEKDPAKCEMMKKEMYEMMKKEMAKMSEMDDMPEMSEMMKKEMMKEIMKKMDEYGHMNSMKKESIDEKHKPGHKEMMTKEGGPGSGPQKDKMKPGAGTRKGSAKDGGQTDKEADDYDSQIAGETYKKEMAMNAMKMNAMKMPIRATYKKEMKTGDDDLSPMNNMKLNAMIKDPHKSKEEDPKRDMNAGYMKSDVRADVKNGGGADMSKVKDAPKMQTAMKKINAMYKTEKYHDTKPGSIQDVVAQMYQTEDKEVTVEDKKLDDMIKAYLTKGGTITKLPPALQKGAKPTAMKKHKVGDKGVIKSMKMKEVREFISTYNLHFLTNYKAEEFILKD